MPFTLTRRGCGGVSEPPFDTLNLATHVGDDPSAVAANRAELTDALRSLGVRRLVWMRQVHGDRVAVVDHGGLDADTDDRGDAVIAGVDALVTTDRGLGLVVQVADCVPVVLRDETAGVVAVAHAGRRGVANGIVGRALSTMRQLGAAKVVAHLGPSICGSCYEVPADLQAEVERQAPGSATSTRVGTPGLDLAGALVRQLECDGVVVDRDPRCTMEDPELFSYRRDATTGRFAAVAWRE